MIAIPLGVSCPREMERCVGWDRVKSDGRRVQKICRNVIYKQISYHKLKPIYYKNKMIDKANRYFADNICTHI